jgi:hypothetical protein
MNSESNYNNSNIQELASAILKLPNEQKLQLNDLLWMYDMPIQDEHQQIILDRMANANDSNMIDWEVAKKMLK